MPAQVVSHYRLLGPLGSGGMGVVYRAEDTSLLRTVALKFLSSHSTCNATINDRLRDEARAASALNHPNICTIYEVGEDAGEMFIAMECVEGRTLAEIIRQGPLPLESVLRYGRQIASALAHAHDRGVIHGDLKPLNIIVTPLGDAKILDFGLARRNNPGEFDRQTLETLSSDRKVGLAGTLSYMAPEQIEGGDPSPRTDIWSLGVVLYEMATGIRPFRGENLYLLCNSILRDTPRLSQLQIPPGFETIILGCLDKQLARRYQRASEARAALETLTPSLERDVLPPTRRIPSRRLRAIIGMSFLALLAAVGTIVIRGVWFWRNSAPSGVPSQVVLGVLPPASTDASESAFGNGLADTLNSRLGELSARHPLSVIPMNLTLEKRVTTIDAARQQFGVNLALVLTVQRAAGNVRVNYALVDAHSHQQVRSGTITAAATDPFGLQDRVFESVAAAMEVQLAPQEKQSLTAPPNRRLTIFTFRDEATSTSTWFLKKWRTQSLFLDVHSKGIRRMRQRLLDLVKHIGGNFN
jgi:serine/threonine protein kinase